MSRDFVSVCLFGPESTGKTTLARALAGHFRTVFVPEYGRFYCETFGNECDAEDLRAIVRGHNALVEAARRKAARLLILDTDAVMTAVWADILLGRRPADLDEVADPADLYLLAGIDVPFERDSIRYFPDQAARQRFFVHCREELERRQLPFVALSGDREARFETAVAAIHSRFGAMLQT